MPISICPETEIYVYLPVKEIPDGATVMKKNGQMRVLLRHSLTIYDYKPQEGDPVPNRESTKPSLEIKGYFLINDNGGINQVDEGKQLLWCVSAEDFVQSLEQSWTVEQ